MSIRQRRPLPKAIANAPELWLGLELFFVAFLDLNTERDLGFAEGPVKWSAVEQWCDAYDITGDQREDVHYHIKQLDTVYLEHRSKQSKKSSSDGSKIIRPQNPGNGPRRRS